MKYEIWSANIIIGEDPFVILEKHPVKKLPLDILLSDSKFISWLKSKIKDKVWTSFKKYKITGLPKIKIVYLTKIGL